MIDYNSIFQRREQKYLVTDKQLESVMRLVNDNMGPDRFPVMEVRNIYCDTDDYLLIRRSIEKPTYKEKLRLRCYDRPEPSGSVFIEMKKKYKGIVYKRRLSVPMADAVSWLDGVHGLPDTQIGREIDFMRVRYPGIGPKMMITYDREAYSNGDFRLTVDRNVLARTDSLDLASEPYGTPVLPSGYALIEVKALGGIPLWLVECFSKEKVYKSSFSKYGNAYKIMILHKQPENYPQ